MLKTGFSTACQVLTGASALRAPATRKVTRQMASAKPLGIPVVFVQQVPPRGRQHVGKSLARPAGGHHPNLDTLVTGILETIQRR